MNLSYQPKKVQPLRNLFNNFLKIDFVQKRRYVYSLLLSNGFFSKDIRKDKVSEIVYSFIANGCKYCAIIFEQWYKCVPVWSIVG